MRRLAAAIAWNRRKKSIRKVNRFGGNGAVGPKSQMFWNLPGVSNLQSLEICRVFKSLTGISLSEVGAVGFKSAIIAGLPGFQIPQVAGFLPVRVGAFPPNVKSFQI